MFHIHFIVSMLHSLLKTKSFNASESMAICSRFSTGRAETAMVTVYIPTETL